MEQLLFVAWGTSVHYLTRNSVKVGDGGTVNIGRHHIFHR